MMRNILSKFKSNYRTWRYNYGHNIKYYNFWIDQRPEEMWLSIFIRKHFPKANNKRININSVLGPEWMIKDNRKGVNIFYTGENLHAQRFDHLTECLNKSHFDLYVGFDKSEEQNHIRIPIWLMWCFPPEGDITAINEIVRKMRFPKIDNKREFCCMVSSHDWSGLRGEIMDNMQRLGAVSSAGAFRHNTDALQKEFGDDKVSFMSNYKFAICPENMDTEGYVTEKIFDAILAGCIPIYNGSKNKPEPEIINHDSIVFWETNKDNSLAVNKIIDIMMSDDCYREFASQPRLKKHAEDYVVEMYHSLKRSLSSIL